MTITTHRGITYTGTGTFTTTVNLDLQMQGGVDQDDAAWLTDYPGGAGTEANALNPFNARQSDGTNRGNPRLLVLTLSSVLTEGNTLTLSSATTSGAQISKILGAQATNADATAQFAMVKTSDLVLTFDIEAEADNVTDDLAGCELWLLVV